MTSVDLARKPTRRFSTAGISAILSVALALATVVAYAPVRDHPFISLDDHGYVTANPQVQQLNWQTVRWSLTTFHASNWHPVTWLSHALDCRLFGLDAGRHHETNLLLHVLNGLLLFWVLARATGCSGRSFAVAALFALHPINVESVAWIAERKNLLSMFFCLLTLAAYRWYAQKPVVPRYVLVAVLFALGLMSKPQVVTLPFVLLLWDYWPLRRMFATAPLPSSDAIPAKSFRWLILEKLPLLALSAASAVLTIKAQNAGGTTSGAVNLFSPASRISNSVLAYVRYLGKAVWPTHLAFFYPHPRSLSAWQAAAASLLLLIITLVAVTSDKQRYLAVGWLWFLGTLVPMIGLVQVGSQAMADRYAYLPFVGLFIAICWGVADVAEHWRFAEIALPAATIAILLLLTVATRRQLSYWSDELTLWTHSAEVVKDNWLAENMIGEHLLKDGDPEAAIPHFRAAAAMEPLFAFPHLHIGVYDVEHQHPREALLQLQQVIDLTDADAAYTSVIRSNALVYMSYAYNQLGDYASQEKYLDMAAHQLR